MDVLRTIVRARRGTSGAVLQMLFSLGVVAAPTCALGEGFSRVSLPIPIEIDGRPVHCQLYFKLEVKNDNVPFERFAVGRLNDAQTMFVTAVQAIRKGDAAKFASVWTAPNQMRTSGRISIALGDDNRPVAWMNVARSNFDFSKAIVAAEAQAGSYTMFVLDAPTNSGTTLRTAFYVGPDKNNQTRLSAVSSAVPVLALALDAFRAAQIDPGTYRPLPNINLRYQYPIPLSGGTSPGRHPVFFEFNGSPVDFSVTDENVKPPTALLAFIRDENLAEQSGKNDLYASSFTPKSQVEVRRWLASQGAKPSRMLPLRAGNVKFVLSAEPVFLVFSAPRAGNDWTPENLTYTYVVQEGGTYKIANFSDSGSLDDFLQDPSLFDKRILKLAPAKSLSRP
jgi:hypothetical protein